MLHPLVLFPHVHHATLFDFRLVRRPAEVDFERHGAPLGAVVRRSRSGDVGGRRDWLRFRRDFVFSRAQKSGGRRKIFERFLRLAFLALQFRVRRANQPK